MFWEVTASTKTCGSEEGDDDTMHGLHALEAERNREDKFTFIQLQSVCLGPLPHIKGILHVCLDMINDCWCVRAFARDY